MLLQTLEPIFASRHLIEERVVVRERRPLGCRDHGTSPGNHQPRVRGHQLPRTFRLM